MMNRTCEQKARDLLERMAGCRYYDDPQQLSAGDVVELAGMFSEIERLRDYADKLVAGLPEGMLPADVDVLRSSNSKMATEIERLQSELRDRDEWFRARMSESCGDEKHCTCVPELKSEIERLCAELEERTLQHRIQLDNAVRLEREAELLHTEIERLRAIIDDRNKVARAILDDLSQFTRVEWLVDVWPWLVETPSTDAQGCPPLPPL